jgi:hypothetical protein
MGRQRRFDTGEVQGDAVGIAGRRLDADGARLKHRFPAALGAVAQEGLQIGEGEELLIVRAGLPLAGDLADELDTRNNRLIWPANRGFEALALF